MPDQFVRFLSNFCDVDVTKLLNEQETRRTAYSFLFEDDGKSKKNNNHLKLLKIKSLFQIMYSIKNPSKKTPQEVLIGIFIYSTTRKKNILRILNRLGISISYEEMLRIRSRLGCYAVESSSALAPIPSHIPLYSYITLAFDNFDHNEATLSGIGSTHDTVITFFFDALINAVQRRKPKISECSIDNYKKNLIL